MIEFTAGTAIGGSVTINKLYTSEVEWLGSTGTQYINLSFGFDPTDEIYSSFSIDTSQTTDKYIVSPISWNTNNNRFALGVHQGGYCCGYG